MTAQSATVYPGLLSRLRELDTSSAFSLIMDILVTWGYELKRRGTFTDPKVTADAFWNKLTYKDLVYSSLINQERVISLTDREIETEGKQWGNLFVQLDYEDSINKFTRTVHEWMISCDLSLYLSVNDNNPDKAMLDMYREFGAALGVD